MVPKLLCYLLRTDGEWYELGDVPRWQSSFTTFPGPADGSVVLTAEDAPLLGLRLDGYGHEPKVRERVAADIVRWACGKRFRFVTELDPEVEPDVRPSPITGSIQGVGP